METLLTQFTTGQLGIATFLAWFGVAILVGAAGGAMGGLIVGANAIGKELAAMMGAFYGVVAAVPGVLLSIIILSFF